MFVSMHPADVVGAKIYRDLLLIRHIETGQLSSGRKSAASVARKFSPVVEKPVIEYFVGAFSFTGDVQYSKLYVAASCSQPVVDELSAQGISVEPVPLFITKRVLPAVEAWKQSPPHQPRSRANITLPESNWLLQMLDHLATKGLLAWEKSGPEAGEGGEHDAPAEPRVPMQLSFPLGG